jgi:nucleoporin NUP82
MQQASQTASTGTDDTELYAHPVFVTDQGREEVVYIYHAFGVHLLDLSNVIQITTRALRDAVGDGDESRLSGDATGATVSALVSTVLSDK